MLKRPSDSEHTNIYYIIQERFECEWVDVTSTRGDLGNARKIARHIRNQNERETRVVEMREKITHTYEYEEVARCNLESTSTEQ